MCWFCAACPIQKTVVFSWKDFLGGGEWGGNKYMILIVEWLALRRVKIVIGEKKKKKNTDENKAPNTKPQANTPQRPKQQQTKPTNN